MKLETSELRTPKSCLDWEELGNKWKDFSIQFHPSAVCKAISKTTLPGDREALRFVNCNCELAGTNYRGLRPELLVTILPMQKLRGRTAPTKDASMPPFPQSPHQNLCAEGGLGPCIWEKGLSVGCRNTLFPCWELTLAVHFHA